MSWPRPASAASCGSARSGQAATGSCMDERLGVLISGRGSNLQALIDAIADGRLDARIAAVISNRSGAAGLERAAAAGIETLVVDHKLFTRRHDFDAALA